MVGFLSKRLPTYFAERRDIGHDGELHLLEARRGRGKSYGLTWWARQAVLQRVPVVANFGLNHYRLAAQAAIAGAFPSAGAALAWVADHVRVIDTWDGLLQSHDAVVLLDEVSRVFDSRHRSAPPVAFEWFQQSRKLRATVVLAAQSFDWLDVRIRQLADVLWMVRKETPKGGGLPLRFWWYGLDPWAQGLSESVLRDRADYRVDVPFRREVATLYNSWEVIRVLEGAPSWASMGELAAHLEAQGARGIRSRLGGTVRGGVASAVWSGPEPVAGDLGGRAARAARRPRDRVAASGVAEPSGVPRPAWVPRLRGVPAFLTDPNL